jgi:hypothetical protein
MALAIQLKSIRKESRNSLSRKKIFIYTFVFLFISVSVYLFLCIHLFLLLSSSFIFLFFVSKYYSNCFCVFTYLFFHLLLKLDFSSISPFPTFLLSFSSPSPLSPFPSLPALFFFTSYSSSNCYTFYLFRFYGCRGIKNEFKILKLSVLKTRVTIF